jgi:hypothetical protein
VGSAPQVDVRGVSPPATTDTGKLRLHRGAVLSGRITDTKGRPVAGATVATGLDQTIPTNLPYPGPDWTHTQFTATTDAQGRYTMTRMDPARRVAVVYAYDKPLAWQWSGEASDPAKATPLTLAYDRTTGYDAQLQPAATIAVTVKGATTVGTVAAYTPSGASVGWPTTYTTDGTYLITGLPRSTVYVAVGTTTQRSWFDQAPTITTAKPLAARPSNLTSITLTLP